MQESDLSRSPQSWIHQLTSSILSPSRAGDTDIGVSRSPRNWRGIFSDIDLVEVEFTSLAQALDLIDLKEGIMVRSGSQETD